MHFNNIELRSEYVDNILLLVVRQLFSVFVDVDVFTISHSFKKITFVCFCLAAMTQTVQANGVQPLSKTWELSLYELQRTPQVSYH